MRAAEWSHKATVEDQQNIPATQARKANGFATNIGQLKIGSKRIDQDFGHISSFQAGFFLSRKAAIRLADTRPKVTQVATVTIPACGNLAAMPASAHRITMA